MTDSERPAGINANAASPSLARTGARILVDALRVQQVDLVYSVPGESFLAVLDALYDTPSIRLVVARHEGAAANMAEADGKLTGRPGICFVTRGPGATQASVGVHTAMQDSTPMILFIGQVGRSFRGREAFQEVEFNQMFGPLAKWVAEIDDPARVPEFISRAFHVAMSGRPGPVVLALPEDMLTEIAEVVDLGWADGAVSAPTPPIMLSIRDALTASQRPLVILGGSGWTDQACQDIRAFAETNGLPVAVSFRRQDLFDNHHPHYVGHLGLGINPKLASRVRNADLLIAVGPRLGETTSSGYALIESPLPRQRLIHIHADPNELGRVFFPEIAVASSMPGIAAALKEIEPVPRRPWEADLRRARDEYLAFATPKQTSPQQTGVDLSHVMSYLNQALPEDALVSNGAGNYTVWIHRFYQYRMPRTELAPTSGAMGYGLPAAIAAKIRYPERTVVCFAGDGCFLMYPQELATAAQEQAAIIVLIVNNGQYGTIRMHQERHFPGRVIGTALANPDFVALARSFGAYSERIDTTEAFPAAFERAQTAGRLAVLDLTVDPAQITPDSRLSVPS